MATTTNYSWTTPDDTALVKDGAAAIRSLGTAIDTTVFNNASAAIAKTIVDAKGDIIAATAADTVARLAVGTNGQVLKANSSTATGLEWGTAGSPATSFALINTGGTALTGASTITVSGLSGYNKFMILITDASSANASSDFSWRLNADSTAGVYKYAQAPAISSPSTYSASSLGSGYSEGDQIYFAKMSSSSSSNINGGLLIDGANSSGVKILQSLASASAAGSNGHQAQIISAVYTGTSVISSVSVLSTSGNFDNGTLYVYGG